MLQLPQPPHQPIRVALHPRGMDEVWEDEAWEGGALYGFIAVKNGIPVRKINLKFASPFTVGPL